VYEQRLKPLFLLCFSHFCTVLTFDILSLFLDSLLLSLRTSCSVQYRVFLSLIISVFPNAIKISFFSSNPSVINAFANHQFIVVVIQSLPIVNLGFIVLAILIAVIEQTMRNKFISVFSTLDSFTIKIFF